MDREIIKQWEDGTSLYIEEGTYKLEGKWGIAELLVCRTPLGAIATTSNKEVPKILLAEIGHNI